MNCLEWVPLSFACEGENEVVLKTDGGLCARRRIFRTRP